MAYRAGSAAGFTVFLLLLPTLLAAADGIPGGEPPEIQAERLLAAGRTLSERTHYLEAVDCLEEAVDRLTQGGLARTPLNAEILYTLAQAKIKGRLHQGYPAHYVKTALEDVQAANKLMDQLPGILPQKLGDGYYLEGYIHWRFFKRKPEALTCFQTAVAIDPGNAAAKRALSELIGGGDAN